jgi:hypothetical protein
VIEDRHERRATLVTSQLPLAHWHEAIGDPTLADAILDRLIHSAYQIALKGDSMRKRLAAANASASKAAAESKAQDVPSYREQMADSGGQNRP